jgi:hypothetical protein
MSCCTMQDTHQLFIATITSWVLTCAPAAAVTRVYLAQSLPLPAMFSDV